MRRIFALAILTFAIRGGAVFAQEVAAWYANSPDAPGYISVRKEFLELAERSIAGMHSDRPLAERLAEGALKHVAPPFLFSALEAETDRLLDVASDLKARDMLPTDARSAGGLMSQIGIALRAGLEPRDVDAAFDGAISRVGRGAEARNRAIAVLSAVAGLSLGPDQRLALVGALAASPLPTARFEGVRGTLADFFARNMSAAEASAALIDSFEARPPTDESRGDETQAPPELHRGSKAQELEPRPNPGEDRGKFEIESGKTIELGQFRSILIEIGQSHKKY